MIKKIKSSVYQICISLIIVILFMIASYYPVPFLSNVIKKIDNTVYDQVIRQNWHNKASKVEVVIIDIDTKSMNEQGKWPWPRDKLARLISALKNKGVVVIVLDIVMTEADINYAKGLKEKLSKLPDSVQQAGLEQRLTQLAPLVDNDTLLAKAVSNQDVVLGFLLHQEKKASKGTLPSPVAFDKKAAIKNLHQFEGYSGSLPKFMKAAHSSGFVTNIPDSDGKIRKGILLARHDGNTYASLALQAARTYLLTDSLTLKTEDGILQGIYLDQSFIPTTKKGEILIPFYGDAGSLNYYSATDIINNRVPGSALDGSIAIIGSSMILISDLHSTPVSSLFPGAELIGNMVTGIISQQIIQPLTNHSTTATMLITFIGSIFAFLFPVISPALMVFSLLLTLAVIVAIMIIALVYFQVYLPIAVLMLILSTQAIINAIYAYLIEKRQRQKISHLFGQYVPESYVEELIKSDESLSMEGEVRKMTALFTDIRNFTNLSQSLHASEVKTILNSFFTPITKIIFDNKGTIDKYVGDMVMAFWGAPINDPQHAHHAIQTAMAIIEQLPKINNSMKQFNLPQIKVGIGLASGEMNVGDMGSEFRRSYTVLGDTVNLASRLENLTKFYQLDILVNDTLVKQVEQIIWLPVDKVTVKGRDVAETIYHPLGWEQNISPTILSIRQQYLEALTCYYQQEWDNALTLFEQLIRQYPENHLFRMYYHRIKSYMKTPPPKDWQGVYIHKSK